MKNEMLEFQKNALLGNISGTSLCEAYKAAWRQCGDDKEMLVRLALQQQAIPYFSHACYSKLGLSKKYILENFSEYINGKRIYEDVEGVKGFTYSLYVGYEGDVEVNTDVVTFMWCKNVNVVIPQTKATRIYVSNQSELSLSLSGYNSPAIYLFDESSVNIVDSGEESDVIIYKYSNRADVYEEKYSFARIKVFNKELKL